MHPLRSRKLFGQRVIADPDETKNRNRDCKENQTGHLSRSGSVLRRQAFELLLAREIRGIPLRVRFRQNCPE